MVAVIDVPYFCSSQIIIFYDKEYYDTFWDRNDNDQKWTVINNSKLSLAKERGIATDLTEIGYTETLMDEDGYYKNTELWFYGDLKN